MGVVVGLFLLTIFVLLMVHIPAFRILVFAAILIALAGFGFFHFQEEIRDRKSKSPSMLAIPKINASFSLGGASKWLQGTIINTSDNRNINLIEVRVSVFNCANPRTQVNCLVVGEDTVILSTNVPAGQQRSFSTTVYLPDMGPITGNNWSWKMETLRVHTSKK